MKLTDKLKTQVESSAAKEEKKDAIKQTDMLLSNDDLDLISGGKQEDFLKKYCLLHVCYDSYECPQCAAESQD